MRREEIRARGTRPLVVASTVANAVLLIAVSAGAAPKAELWARWQQYDPASRQQIDHTPWDRFLKQYVVTNDPAGIHRVHYQGVTPEDRKILKNYLQALQAIFISNHNRAEQRSYWINLYNAATADLILGRFPVASIRDINISPGFLARGPWGAKLFSIEGENYPSMTSSTASCGRSGKTTGFITR